MEKQATERKVRMILENRNKTVYDIIFSNKNILLDSFMILASIFLLAITANIRVPLWPVPVTLQTMGVFFIAFFLGSKRGMLAVLGYIAAGLVGFGVFSGYKSGIVALTGPTGGYLVGMVIMAFIVGLMIERGFGRTNKSVIICMLIGETVLYAFGLTWLYMYLGNASLIEVLSMGLFPFIVGDIVKGGIAVASFPYLFKRAEKLLNN